MNIVSNYKIGSDLIGRMINIHHPLLLLDGMVDWGTINKPQITEFHISSNDPVFEGHFPNFKLWPGIHTIEGLKQSCLLNFAVKSMKGETVFQDLVSLQNYVFQKPISNSEKCKTVLSELDDIKKNEPTLSKIRVKLLQPVYAGCVIKYQVQELHEVGKIWDVIAKVNDKIVAKGQIEFN